MDNLPGPQADNHEFFSDYECTVGFYNECEIVGRKDNFRLWLKLSQQMWEFQNRSSIQYCVGSVKDFTVGLEW